MRQVDTTTGALKIGTHLGPLKQGQVYSGGNNPRDFFFSLVVLMLKKKHRNMEEIDRQLYFYFICRFFCAGSCEVFTDLIGAKGKDVL